MRKFRVPLYAQALIGMLLGAGVGAVVGPRAAELGFISKFIVEIIKWIATPLLFFAILDAIIRATIKTKGVALLAFVCAVNAVGAITLGLIISNATHAGRYLPVPPLSGSHLADTHLWLQGLQQGLFSGEKKFSLLSGTTAAIFFSLITGIILLVTRWNKRAQPLTQRALQLLFKVIEWVACLIPLAVFSSVAKGVGLYGSSVVKGLAVYFVICFVGMLLQIVLVYQSWISLFAKIPLKRFWSQAKEPAIYAFGINSSLATLPMTLRALKNLNIRDASARLAACLGTNFNNDGILLYEVVAAFFILQAYGIHLDLSQQLMVAVICVIATIGVAGVPEAGLISLTLVMGALKLPVEVIGLLLGVDWVLGRMRSVTNVLGDMTGAIAIDHLH
jgi:Na+/H+-dicarboxylate symporter